MRAHQEESECDDRPRVGWDVDLWVCVHFGKEVVVQVLLEQEEGVGERNVSLAYG